MISIKLASSSNNTDLTSLFTYFHQIHPREIDLELGRMYRLLQALGNPQHRLPPVIHVAGTNGKGSTVSFLRYIYEAAGYRVHCYTSPHLIRFNERIRLAGSLITDKLLAMYLTKVKEANQDNPITFFEATTAAAFLAFSEIPADVVLLETGLGGRLDATNVIENPAACVITPISMDHQDFLGDSILKIAREKAGIIKEKTPLFIAPQVQEVETLLCEKAKGAAVYLYGREWAIKSGKDEFQLTFNKQEFALPLPSLPGEHQLLNAGLAASVVLGMQSIFSITLDHIKQGIKKAFWPGRLQKLGINGDVWLDGAHNAHGFECLEKFMQNSATNSEKTIMMVAMLKNRDPALFFDKFGEIADQFILFDMQEERFHPAEALLSFCKGKGEVVPFPGNIKSFLEKKTKKARIFLTGSLYLVGRVLDSLEQRWEYHNEK